MSTKKRSVISTTISLCMVVTFLIAAPAWSKRDGKKIDIKDSTESSLLDRDVKKGEGKSTSKVKKKLVKKVAIGAATGAAVGVATKKVTSGPKDTGKDVAK